jgi:hypothetical protein
MEISDGLHCRACDASLGDATGDGELCGECLGVVRDLNHDLYFKDELSLEEKI